MSAIQAAMDELMAEIQARQDAVAALRPLLPLTLTAPMRTEARSARMVPVVAKANGTATPKVKPKEKRNGGDGLGQRIQTAIAAHQPSDNFSMVDVHGWLKDMGEKNIEIKQVNWMLKYEAQMGRLQVAVRGKPGSPTLYEVPTKATATKSHERLPGPGQKNPGRTKAQMESELTAALKERDQHRADGRVTLEGIAQKKVDRLEEELEKFQ